MLSIGWTEMMVVAAVALIVVGPKDLPAMLRQVGRAMGSIRKMGNEFKAELNKVTAVDELKDIKRSIAAPLQETRRKIEDEFNSITPDGKVVPSGKLVPDDPETESVVDQIRDTSGVAPAKKTSGKTRKSAAKATGKGTSKRAVKSSTPKSSTPKSSAPKGGAAKGAAKGASKGASKSSAASSAKASTAKASATGTAAAKTTDKKTTAAGTATGKATAK